MTAVLLDPMSTHTGWIEEPRPRAHTELGERTRSTLGEERKIVHEGAFL